MQIGIAVVFTWALLLNLGKLTSARAPVCLTQSKTSEALIGGSRRGACTAPSSPLEAARWGLGPALTLAAWTPRDGRARGGRQAMVVLAGCRRDDAFLQGRAA